MRVIAMSSSVGFAVPIKPSTPRLMAAHKWLAARPGVRVVFLATCSRPVTKRAQHDLELAGQFASARLLQITPYLPGLLRHTRRHFLGTRTFQRAVAERCATPDRVTLRYPR